MSPRLAFAIKAARLAGDSALGHFLGAGDFDLKGDDSPVTVADTQAETLIRTLIAEEFPGEAVLGEELGGGQEADRWVVDPIDGTKSFVAGVPLYATLLSYEIDHAPVVGVAYFPGLDWLLAAEKGQGATANGEPCRVRQNRERRRAVVCCGSLPTFQAQGKLDGLMRLGAEVMALRTWCDAYGHALVAAGRVDAMIDPRVKRWDLSAVSLIVREAGGRVTDFAGHDTIGESAVSTNGQCHDWILREIGD